MSTPLTVNDIEAGYLNPGWLGFGYLGERRHLADRVRQQADAIVLHEARRREWTPERFFDWLNSAAGRHFASFVERGERYDIPDHPELIFHEDRNQFFSGDWAGGDGPVEHIRDTPPLDPGAWGLEA
jgi:hypothetical protein